MHKNTQTRVSSPCLHRLPCAGADIRNTLNVYVAADADARLLALLDDTPWRQHRLRLFGREVETPRLFFSIGEQEAEYLYSQTRFVPQQWTPVVKKLRNDFHARLGERFNNVLAKLYRDGQDSIGWHSGDEPEVGEQPLIASLSFGTTCAFARDARDRALARTHAWQPFGDGGELLVRG